MATRAVAIIAKAREVIEAVAAIPADSRTVRPGFSDTAGDPGIFLQRAATLTFAGQDIRGLGPGAASLFFGFDVVIIPGALSEETPLEDLVDIAESIRLAFETSATTDIAWKGLGALFIADAHPVAVNDAEAVIQVNFTAHGFV